MAYLGNDLQVAYQSYKIIDDISSSFNSSLTSFALQVGGVTPVPFPINPQQCLISVNGVVQEPDPTGTSGFNLVGSNIVFASAPTTGHSFFGVILAGADYVNVGVNYPSGSESAPSITFNTDLDTGIYNPAANELGLVTNGNEALRIDSAGDVTIGSDLTVDTDTLYVDSANNRVGIGTTSPSELLQVDGGNLLVRNNSGNNITLSTNVGNGNASTFIFQKARGGGSGPTQIFANDDLGSIEWQGYDGSSYNEAAKIRCKSTTNTGDFDAALIYNSNEHVFQNGVSELTRIDSSGRLLVGTSSTTVSTTVVLQGRSGATTGEAILRLCRGQDTPSDGATLGDLNFGDSNNGDAARIFAQRDGGTWTSATSRPSRLVFSTTADGASSPTERMRITQAGNVSINTTDTGSGRLHVVTDSTTLRAFAAESSNASFTDNIIISLANRTASEFFAYFAAYNKATVDTDFTLRGDGNAFADGTWSGGGADYAEYFEWSDGNHDEEDRRGISVVLDGDRIRPAVDGEDPIGVISSNPSVVGDAAWNKWSGKYLRDDYGTYIQEDYEVVNDEGETVIQQRRKLNPDYDPDQEYVNREQRPEWDCVGLMGKLRIRKGQVTGVRWIKMRDISDSVEEWLVR